MRMFAVQYNSGLHNILDELYFDGSAINKVREICTTPITVYGMILYQGRLLITNGTSVYSLNIEDGSTVQTRTWGGGVSGLYGIAVHGNILESAVYSSPYWYTLDLSSNYYFTPANITAAKGGNGLAHKNNQYWGSRVSSYYLVYNSEVNQNRVLLLNNSPYSYPALQHVNGQLIAADNSGFSLYQSTMNLMNLVTFQLASFTTDYRKVLIL